jgi:hypothetical protein
MITKELLHEEYIVNNRSTLQIAKMLGCCAETIRKLLQRHGIPIRPARKIPIDITSERFGSLTVVQQTRFEGKLLWECRCDCGNTVYLRSGNLRRKNNTTCGCRINNIGEQHKAWSGCGEISGYVWGQIKWTAGLRKENEKNLFTIKIEEAWDMYLRQKRRCALSGLEIKFAATANEHRAGATTASLDRIDSCKGYTKDNLQWVHKEVNAMKSDFKQDRFVELCKIITEYHYDRLDQHLAGYRKSQKDFALPEAKICKEGGP